MMLQTKCLPISSRSRSRSAAIHSCSVSSSEQYAERRRRVVVARSSRVLHGDHGHGDHTVPWYKKHPELWQEIDGKEARAAALAALPPGKLLLVDYYAPQCAVCKTAFPSVSRVAASADYQAHYVFFKASLEHPEVKEWVKAEGITGIPHLCVYTPQGAKLLGMGASFKKVEQLKANLSAIAANMEAVVAAGRQLELDPNQFVLIGDRSAAAPAAAAAAAAAVQQQQ